MKKFKATLFLRSFAITTVIIFCFTFVIVGTAKAYEGIREIDFGDYREAFEIKDGRLKILDFEISLYSSSEKET